MCRNSLCEIVKGFTGGARAVTQQIRFIFVVFSHNLNTTSQSDDGITYLLSKQNSFVCVCVSYFVVPSGVCNYEVVNIFTDTITNRLLLLIPSPIMHIYAYIHSMYARNVKYLGSCDGSRDGSRDP